MALALAPIYPGSLFACLDECVANMTRSLEIMMWRMWILVFCRCSCGSASRLLHLHLSGILPRLPGRTGVVSTRGLKNIYRASALQWTCVKQSTDNSLVVFIDKEEKLQPQAAFVPTGIHRVHIFEEGSLEVVLVPRSSVPVKDQCFLGLIAPTLLLYMLEFAEALTVYNPQQMLRQFGCDQGAVTLIGEQPTSSSLLLRQDSLVAA